MSREQDLPTELVTLLLSREPKTLLAVGAAAAAAGDRYRRSTAGVGLTSLAAEAARVELPKLGVHDLALLAGDWHCLPAADARALLAALRDVYARAVVALLPGHQSTSTHSEMIAMGFSSLGRPRAGDAELFQYEVSTYKTTPDWLNSRHWANPQLWDKHRW